RGAAGRPPVPAPVRGAGADPARPGGAVRVLEPVGRDRAGPQRAGDRARRHGRARGPWRAAQAGPGGRRPARARVRAAPRARPGDLRRPDGTTARRGWRQAPVSRRASGLTAAVVVAPARRAAAMSEAT